MSNIAAFKKFSGYGWKTSKRVVQEFENKSADAASNAQAAALAKVSTIAGTQVRKQLYSISGKVIGQTGAWKTITAKIQNIISGTDKATPDSEIGKSIQEFLIALQTDIFVVFDPKKTEASTKRNLDLFRTSVKSLVSFNGQRVDTARAKLSSSKGSIRDPDIREAIKVGETPNADNYFEEVLPPELIKRKNDVVDWNSTVDTLSKDALDKVKKYIIGIIEDTKSDKTLLGLEAEELQAIKSIEQLDKALNEQYLRESEAENPTKIQSTTLLEKKTIYYIYTYTPVTNETTYVLIKLKVSSVGLEPEVFSIDKAFYEPDTNQTIIVDAVTKETIINRKGLIIPFLNYARQVAQSDEIVFPFEHSISIGTEQIRKAYIIMHEAGNIIPNKDWDKEVRALMVPQINKCAKIADALWKILQISMKVDSLFTSFTDISGQKLVLDSEDPLTREAIITLLQGDIDYTKFNFVYMEGKTLKTRQGAERTLKLEVNQLGVEYGTLAKGTLGIFGTPQGNRVKGEVTKALLDLIRKVLTAEIEASLIDDTFILNYITGTRSDDFLTSVAIQSGLKNLGFEHDLSKGKKSRKTIKKTPIIKGTNINTKPATIPRRQRKGKKPQGDVKAYSVGSKSTVVTVAKQRKSLSNNSIVNIINTNISAEIMRVMRKPALVNRTGRFAGSVRAISLQGNELAVRYMNSPYDVFSIDRGKAPWNSERDRDPMEIISKAIRIISAKNKLSGIKVKRER